MRIKIYQMNENAKTKFLGLKAQNLKDNTVDASQYEKVFDADINESNLEGIFQQFNTTHHPLFRGHSLSVSDIVIRDDGAHFCDVIGFEPVKFDESQAIIPEDTYKVVYVEPHKPAYVTEIGKDLTSLQRAVGGFIEAIYDTDDETLYVGNEESKLIGMDGNRHMSNGRGIIAGPFFVIGEKDGDFRSLTDEEVEKYLDKFSQPEDISAEEVQADTGYSIFGFNPEM